MKLHELCGWMIWRGLPMKYLEPIRWYNRWIWRFGAQNAIARSRGFGEQPDKECCLCQNTGFLSGMGHNYPDCPVCKGKEA